MVGNSQVTLEALKNLPKGLFFMALSVGASEAHFEVNFTEVQLRIVFDLLKQTGNLPASLPGTQGEFLRDAAKLLPAATFYSN